MTIFEKALTDQRIRELRAAAIPHLDINFVTPENGDLESPDFVAARAYLEDNAVKFADPVDNKCLNCRQILVGFLIGTFTWGVIHGEGYCANCGWPARAYHYYALDGKERRFEAVLQYHPNQLIMEAGDDDS